MKKSSRFYRSIVLSRTHLLCFACFAFSLSSPSIAICTATLTVACLADQPIQSANEIKPNVMFILDNSGSMVWDLMSQDSALSGDVNTGKYCRENYQYNTVYYNPNIDYTAAVPKDASNTSMGNQTFTNARKDPFDISAPYSYTNLSLSTSAGFCAEGETYSNNNCNNGCCTGSATTTTNYQPAFYYKYTGAGSPGTACSANANYTKVIVGASSCSENGDITVCPTGVDERVNFANWYSYYRTRILMMKSGMSTAFSTIDDKIRVGFHTINNPNSGNSSGRSLNIDDFAATQKNNWYTALWSIAPSGGTPLQNALARVGNYYSNAGTKTGLSGEPVLYSCQKNFTILSTDGYWNNASTSIGDQDKTVPASMPIRQGATTYNSADTGLTLGAQYPRPYYEGSTVSSDSLADVAMYYWASDLRTSGSVAANNVPTTNSDPAYWQHMNTFTIGLGVNGTRKFPDDYAKFVSGALDWPKPVADTLSAVDDLWHAAINGRGQYYRATDPTSLSNSLNSALKAVSDVPTYGVGPATSTNDFKSPDQSDYTTYVSSYRVINWSGDVKKYAVDRTTGVKTGDALWSAAKQLDSKVNPGLTSTVNTTTFKTRNIVTRTEAGIPVAFDYATLSSSQKMALCYKVTPPGTGACVAGDSSLVDYLRGEAKYEGAYGIGSSRFRDRHDLTETNYFRRDLIGTIVNAQPAYVAAESSNYQEDNDPGFADFKTTTKSRTAMLYVPANDGMLHALDAATGNELWAYVPSLLIPTATDENGKEKGLRALSYQDSGAPAYSPHFYIDATPAVGVVDFARTGGPIPPCTSKPCTPLPVWKNILVGGLGKGGKSYYALDVTTPATSLDDAKIKVLWEFPNSADTVSQAQMGYSFGQPLIAKTSNYGWVVILPSGYNNSDGYGYVFVLNAKTGALLETLKTTTTALGMAHITFLAQTNNLYAEQVYGGDLNGNVWRFDFLAHSPALLLTERVSQIFSSSNNTPISSEVNVSIDVNTGDRWVMFGTGQYLDVPDRATTGTQYLVSLRDGTVDTPKATGGVATPLSSLTTLSSLTGSSWSCATSGWKYALPGNGERVAVNPAADLQTVIFASLIPTSDPCSPGGTGNIYGLDYCSGHSRLKVNGSIVPFIGSLPGPLPSPEAPSQPKIGPPKLNINTPVPPGVTVSLELKGINSGTRHVGWRELLNEY